MFGINVQYDLETINGGVLKKERTETNIVPTISRVWTLDLTVQTQGLTGEPSTHRNPFSKSERHVVKRVYVLPLSWVECPHNPPCELNYFISDSHLYTPNDSNDDNDKRRI